jgi:hypothetical protein
MPVMPPDRDCGQLSVGDLDTQRVAARVQLRLDRRPERVRVAPINSTTTSWLSSGRPRQLAVIWLNNRCSILFHLEVPGGKWQTVTARPVAAANRASWVFHSLSR